MRRAFATCGRAARAPYFIAWMVSFFAVSAADAAGQVGSLTIRANDYAASGVVLFPAQGSNALLTVIATNPAGQPMDVSAFVPQWSIDNPDVVSMYDGNQGPSVRIVGQNDGHARVTVTVLGQTATQRVAVGKARTELTAADLAPEFRVARLELRASDPTMMTGRGLLLETQGRSVLIRARAFNAAGGEIDLDAIPVTWTSTDPSVVELYDPQNTELRIVAQNDGRATVSGTIQGVTVPLEGYVGAARAQFDPALASQVATAAAGQTFAAATSPAAPAAAPAPMAPAAPAPTAPTPTPPAPAATPQPIRTGPVLQPAPAPAPSPAAPAPAAPAPNPTPPAAVPQPSTPPSAPAPSGSGATTATTNAMPQAGPIAGRDRGGSIASEPDPVLTAPTGVLAIYGSGGVIDVAWDPVAGATSYDLLQTSGGNTAGASLTPFTGNSGQTFALAPGQYTITVIATDASGQRSPASLGYSVVVPRWYGRYRVTINGVRANVTTIDNALNVDGKGDEIYVQAEVQEFDEAGAAKGPLRTARTRTHGDVNHNDWRDPASPKLRFNAGSASQLGGIVGGNSFPGAIPWQRNGPAVYDFTFPLLVWEGDVFQDVNSVLITPVIWESDEAPPGHTPAQKLVYSTVAPILMKTVPMQTTLLRQGKQFLRRERAQLAPMIALPVSPARLGAVFNRAFPVLQAYGRLAGVTLAQWNAATAPLVSQAQSTVNSMVATAGLALQLMQNSRDREIGTVVLPDGKLGFEPNLLKLTYDTVEDLIANKATDLPSGVTLKAPGILEFRYVDTAPGGAGDYSLFVEVQRLQ